MSTPLRKFMISALKALVVPELKKRGFTGKFPDFRRIVASRTDFLSFQFDRNGGGFLIEISQTAPGEIVTYRGERIPAEKLTPFDLDTKVRRRVQPKPGGSTRDWFRFDDFEYQRAAESVLPYVDVADRWFTEHQDSRSVIPYC